MKSALERLHKEVLDSQIRVKTAKAGGSGTILYSATNTAGNGFSTFALTCHHVIDEAISVKEEWDPRVGRQKKKEYRQVVTAEFFDYSNVQHGRRPVNYSTDADIVAYDATHDLALLKLRTIKVAPAVAALPQPREPEQIVIGTAVVAAGSALLHDPILTTGMVTHQGDEIDYKDYWMSNAAIVFGNSGGAMFAELAGVWKFIGVPSRVAIVGWGSPVTHLGYFSPIHRVYEFFYDHLYHFLIPGSTHSESECEQERADRDEKENRRGGQDDEVELTKAAARDHLE